MIKIKLGQLPGIVNSFNKLLEKEIPIKTAYTIGKIAKKVADEHKDFEENRVMLLQKYGQKDEKGELIVKDDTVEFMDMEGFVSEFGELSGIETELDIKPIAMDMLGDIKISAADMLILDSFIKRSDE